MNNISEVAKNSKIFDSISIVINDKPYDFYMLSKHVSDVECCQILEAYLTFFIATKSVAIEPILKKNKVNLHEFMLVYFSNPFTFINMSEKTHEEVYSAFFTRARYYITVRVVYLHLQNLFEIPLWIEDDEGLMTMFHAKTYIYLSNLSSKNISEDNLTKSILAINKGFSDLVRFANYSLSAACATLIQSSAFPPILDIGLPYNNLTLVELKRKVIYTCFKEQDIKLSLHKVRINGATLAIVLADIFYNDNVTSKTLLLSEQQKQLTGYLDQIFNFTVLSFVASYRGYLKQEECFNNFEPIKNKLKEIHMYFENLDLAQPISNRTYKKLIEFLNQIIISILYEQFMNLIQTLQLPPKEQEHEHEQNH